MDLADMILTRAKEIEKLERDINFVTIKLSFHIHGSDERPCHDDAYEFSIYPNGKNKLLVNYKTMKWSIGKTGRHTNRLLLTLLRQIMRDVVRKNELEVLDDQLIELSVYHCDKRIFHDDLVIAGPVESFELSNLFSNDCNDNYEMIQLHDFFLEYVSLALVNIF